ncbi:MAG: glycoside hydrolase family 3 C-terminal domain-containing protein [Bacteroidales bacterium]|nr:glycoside hydrolase family 3 C-terminal domain-containing protein [Bacteroidales bacterium]
MKKFFLPVILIAILFNVNSCNKTTYEYPFQDPDLTFEERIDDLVSRMTLEEKVSQMKYTASAIDRLGIPEYNWWNECLHGVARMGKSTVFPQAIGMAATFDQDLMFDISTAISDEARAKYHRYQSLGKRGIYQGLTFWTPNINIFRDPRWGRGMETYGEDPYLTGKLAVSFIKGLQGDHEKYLKAVATSKHYIVHSGPEPDRHSFDAVIYERDFRDTYLPHFKMTVEEANVYSVMCAYNRYLGEACCGSSTLLTEILRNELGFEGYIVSDCWAIKDFYTGHMVSEGPGDASALAVKSGTDLNCGDAYPALLEAVANGQITEEEIDVSVKRLMLARMKLGMFDPDELVPWANIPYETVDSEQHRELALKTARKSIVLLKNENKLLPLSKNLGKIAVIGPNANDVEVLLANYNGIPVNPVTPLQGMIDKLGKDKIIYARGCEHAPNLPTLEPVPGTALFTGKDLEKHGMNGQYFGNQEFEGDPVFERIDENIDFYWWEEAPDSRLDDDDFSVRWTGYIVPPESGTYAVGGEGMNGYTILLDDEQLVRFNSIHHALKRYEFVELEANKPYKIQIDYFEHHGEASMKLLWSVPRTDLEARAIEAASQSDAVVLFMGLSPRLEGEEMRVEVEGFKGGDRTDIDLPDLQHGFIKKIMALDKPTVLVLLSGSAVAINWENDNVPAIVQAWYGGQAAGTAIADVLFGDYNPAGRLPVTFYKSVNDLPDFSDYNMDNRTYRYFTGKPLYPFGYGLSYTTFEYGQPVIEKSEINGSEPVIVKVNVTNTGDLAGDEVVQLYIRDDESLVTRPLREMKGFKRIHLETGESAEVEFSIGPKELEYYDVEQQEYIVEPGTFTIYTGSSSSLNDLKSVQLNVVSE